MEFSDGEIIMPRTIAKCIELILSINYLSTRKSLASE